MIAEILKQRGLILKKKTATELSSPCPFCGGDDRFLIWPEKNRAHCIRGCGWKGDDIQLLRDLDGLSFQEAAQAVGRGDKIKSQSKERQPLKKGKELFVHPTLGKPDKIYRYSDEEGKDLFCVCRFEGKGKDGEKTFSQCLPDGLTWSIKNVRLALYHLPEIRGHKDIAFCEGEKDCDAVRGLGFCATCNPGGAGKLPKQQEEYSILDPLTSKRVFILAHNDEAGRKHAEEAAACLYGKAKEIRIVNLPELPEKGDAYDFIEEHGDQAKALLIEEVFSTPVWSPPKVYYTLQDLMDLPDDNHLPIIESGIMPYNSHILIAGESGVGKSLLRLELALHLAMGWDWMGFKVPRARSVAIFQFENSEHTEKYRIKKMVEGLGTTIQAIGGRVRYAKRDERYNLTLKGDRARLRDRVKALGCDVIVYDCLSNLHTSNENDNIKMREVLDILTDINAELGTACIVIHHFGKPGENPVANSYRIRGASSIMDWGYTVLTFTRKAHEEKDLRKVEFVKVRDGRQPKPFLVERDPETFLCRFYDEETLVSPALVKSILNDELNGVVDKQKDFVTALISKTGCGERTARTGIKKALEMKMIFEYQTENQRAKGYRVSMSG